MTPLKEQTVYIPIPKHSIGTTPIKEIVTIDDGFGQKKENQYVLSKEQLIRLLKNVWGSSQDSCHGPNLPEYGSVDELIEDLFKQKNNS